MLTLYQFNALDLADRIELTENFGAYMELNRRVEGCKVALFALYGFYVEVFLHEEQDRIIKVNSFSSYGKLDQYIQGIDISDIYAML